MPALDALVERLLDAGIEPFGLSVDSRHSHAAWAQSMGGVSFSLLSDFHPKGQVAASFGIYLDQAGISDRATVLIDASGVVRYAASVTPAGKRDIPALVDELIAIAAEHDDGVTHGPEPLAGVPDDAVLYVKNHCAASRAALAARTNLHLEDRLVVKNVSDDPDAKAELEARGGKSQAPALLLDGSVQYESGDIVSTLCDRCAPR